MGGKQEGAYDDTDSVYEENLLPWERETWTCTDVGMDHGKRKEKKDQGNDNRLGLTREMWTGLTLDMSRDDERFGLNRLPTYLPT